MLCSSWDIKTTNIGLDGSVVELLTRKTAVPGLSPGPANNFFSSIPTLFMSFSLIFDKITVSKILDLQHQNISYKLNIKE